MINKGRYKMRVKVSDALKFMVAVDERPAHDACLNYAGWPANEISLLARLQEESPDSPLVDQLERSLMQLPTPKVDNSGKTNSEIIAMIIPRYVGTLSEYLKWVDTLPLSASERQYLDAQAKEQFGDEDSDGDSKSAASTDAAE